ncbi:hypothetical protein, partial [Actinomycetospora straminea]|uniref:hypothetical protein n=1 Tax=Actinomycetospora straminea TaxID=663607 RepID=UPI0023665E7D
MESSARQPGVHGLSASAILEVAEGLRWTDPQLSVALAEHVARSVGTDVGARSAAERSAVLALGQSDRAAALILRAVPQLQAAEREGRTSDAALLRCELARAAVRCDDVDAAEAVLEPLAGGQVLPAAARADALVAWSAARAARGDVPAVDAAARQVEELVGDGAGDVRRLAVQRLRARARRVTGDASGALVVLRGVTTDGAGAGAGRETAMLVADQVELLAELGRGDEARELAAPSLAATPQATTSLAVGRMRCVLASAVWLPAGDVDTAARLAQEAEVDLLDHGHEAQAAEAIEVLAEVAVRRGESRHALDELRQAHAHALAARDETTTARIALAVALATPEGRPARSSDVAESPAVGAGSTPRVDTPRRDDPEGAGLDAVEEPPAAEIGVVEPAASPAADPAPATAPRRRGRYREEVDPSDALAAALAAARGGSLDPFTTPPGGTPVRDEGEAGAPDDPAGGDVDAAAEARSRRLARARARWEVPASILRRRPDQDGQDDALGASLGGRDGTESASGRTRAAGPDDDGAAHENGSTADAGSSGRRRSAEAAGDEPAPRRHRGHRAPDPEDDREVREGRHGSVGAGRVVRAEEDGRGVPGAVGPAGDDRSNGWAPERPVESGPAAGPDPLRDGGLSWDTARPGAGRFGDVGNGVAPVEGHGRGSDVSPHHEAASTPDPDRGPDRHDGPGLDSAHAPENERFPRPADRDHLAGVGDPRDRRDGADQPDHRRTESTADPLTGAAHRDGRRNGHAEVGALAAPGTIRPEDDEYAQELALTLVDLLSEYQPHGVPLGGTDVPQAPQPPQPPQPPPPPPT